MNVDTDNRYASLSAFSSLSPADAGDSAFSSTLRTALASAGLDSTGQDVDVKQIDFSNMTRDELKDWINDKLQSGEMTFDESTTFVSMTVNGLSAAGNGINNNNAEGTFNYRQMIQDGLDNALSHGDQASVASLQSVLSIMQRYQGEQTDPYSQSGVDITA
ncbi:hypothetical protein [Musicola paradisiaca]|uniref:Uncharacterized protein n=1 Tax=Musicola paradisiaca (strain Ech703) TaxID=579405 RepID=C6C789_MUSP7|nr:hypothetical protein [Musicola paradisiaca]ACS84007.1 conserved hypothetical protein [Musicola paradisiaca Ech703]